MGNHIEMGMSAPKVQTDWTETDVNSPAYLKNKPLDPDGFKTYYVDGNNLASGDGSILNPFQTLDLAIAKVIGAGTRDTPENDNITIKVFSSIYATVDNMFVNTLSWELDTGTQIQNAGTGYLVDITSATVTNLTRFSISGQWDFQTFDGGLIRNTVPTTESVVYIEIRNAIRQSGNGATDPNSVPMILASSAYNLGQWIFSSITLVVYGILQSYYTNTIQGDAYCRLYIIGITASATIRAGIGSTPIATQRAIKYVNGDTNTTVQNMYSQDITIKNIKVSTTGEYPVEFAGYFGAVTLDNVIFEGQRQNVIDQTGGVLVGDMIPAAFSGPGGPVTNNFLIRNCLFQSNIYTGSYTITFNGVTPATTKVEISNCIMPDKRVDPNLLINSKIGASYNTITTLNFKTLPEYANQSAAIAAGLVAGDVYRTTAGQVLIVV